MDNHTPGPWVITEFGNVSTLGDEFISVVAVSGFGNLHPETGGCANTRRIVACVNACAGIPDDLLQDDDKNIINRYTQHLRNETVRQADLLAAVTAQRDELLQALIDCKAFSGNYEMIQAITKTAIAKCEVKNDER